MPTQYRFTVSLFDETLVAQLKTAAAAAGESLSAYVSKAIAERITPPAAAHHWTPAATTGDCPRCSKVRAREMAQRRAKGILPHAQRRPSPLSQIVKGTTPVEIE
jgi:hypothetical protein